MWRSHPREGRGLNERVRAAYLALIGESDPALTVRDGLDDRRPGDELNGGESGFIASGPADLKELRAAIEAVTGAGTWPFGTRTAVDGARLTATIQIERRAPALRFVAALEGLVEDRARAWRTWKTVVESVGQALPSPLVLTVDCVVVAPKANDTVDQPS